jgi:hypothetical protein
VVGISLKLVSGKEAKYEEVNTDSVEFKTDKKPSYDTSKLRISLSLKSGTSSSASPQSKNSEFWLETTENGMKVTYQIDIGPTSSSRYTFIKFEAKSSAAKKARLGKAEAEYVRQLLKEYDIPIDKSASDYPLDSEQFYKRRDEFAKMFKQIQKNRLIDSEINDVDEFLTNMSKMFMNTEKGKPVTANSKCQQVALFAGLAKLSQKDLDELGTKIVIAAQKKGGGKYGPFGKIY